MISIKVDGTITCDCDKCHYFLTIRDLNNKNVADALWKNFHFFKIPKKTYHKTLCMYHPLKENVVSISKEEVLKIVIKIKKLVEK